MAGHIGQEKRSKMFLAKKKPGKTEEKTDRRIKTKNRPQIWCAPPFFSDRARHLSLQEQQLRPKLLHSLFSNLSCQSQPTKTKTTPYHILTPLFIITWSALHFSSSSKISGSYPSETASDSQARQSTAATTKSVSILKR